MHPRLALSSLFLLLLAASLTDQILEYQYIQKLTDKITVMLLPSGNGTIFDLKSLINPTAK